MTLDHLTVVPDAGLVITPPRGLLNLATTVIASRRDIALTAERGTMMSELAATLAGQNRDATITTRDDAGTEWTISIGAAETPRS